MSSTDQRLAGPFRAEPGGAPGLLAFLDYDGTITAHENLEIVLQRLVGDAWRPFEDEVRAGRMSHADCLRRQIDLVQVPRAEFLAALVAAAEPAPGLAAFLRELAERGGRAVVVSAGFREAVEAFWRREGLAPVPTFASELVSDAADGGPPYRIAFNPALGDCPICGPKACKGEILRSVRRPGEVVLVFGDGASDACPAREADLVFARGLLAEICAAEGLDWRPLGSFADVLPEVDAWLTTRR